MIFMTTEETLLKNLKILVVEDDLVTIDFIETVLKDEVNELVIVKTGVQAIEALKEHKDIDLILMDLKLPVMNGFNAVKIIRETNKEIPIIAETAFAFPDDRMKSLEAGCNDYISKPFKKSELIDIILKNIKNKNYSI